jgi:hypothetical protein
MREAERLELGLALFSLWASVMALKREAWTTTGRSLFKTYPKRFTKLRGGVT